MKNLLAVTDFTPASDSALNLAMVLAKESKASLTLLHVISSTDTDVTELQGSEDAAKKTVWREADLQLQSRCLKIQRSGINVIDYHILSGSPGQQITHFAESRNMDMIVMGLREETESEEFIYGSTTIDVLEKTSVPVLAVPSAFSIHPPIKKITYAAGLTRADLAAVTTAVDLARIFDAELILLHIGEANGKQEDAIIQFYQFTRQIEEKISYPHLSMNFITSEDLEMELENYVKGHRTDLLIMSTRQRNFMGNIIDPAKTSQIMRVTPLPVLALHHEKNQFFS